MESTSPLNQTSPSAPSPASLVLCPTSATLVALPCLYVLLFLTGLPGNALSLWVFLGRISDTAPTQVYLSHLSASNLLVSLTTPFMVVYYAEASARPAASFLCQLVLHAVTPVLHTNVILSVGFLTWVALSRLAVLTRSAPNAGQRCRPALFRHLRRTSFARSVCVGAWVLVGGSTMLVTLYYSVREAGGGHDGLARVVNGSGPPPGAEGEAALCYSAATELGGGLSRVGQIITITLFFACFLVVLLCYALQLLHVRRPRHATSQGVLRRVFRHIMVIKMVLIFCLVPYNIYKAIFISLVSDYDQGRHSYSSGPKTQHCHPLSSLIEIKNLLLLLAILRGSLDPLIYFLLDRTFRKQTLILLRLRPETPTPRNEGAAHTHTEDSINISAK